MKEIISGLFAMVVLGVLSAAFFWAIVNITRLMVEFAVWTWEHNLFGF